MNDSLAGFEYAQTLVTQLITLATGIIALSITFVKDILKNNAQAVTWPLMSAWIAYLLSICFGILTMMALTGSVFAITENPGASNSVTYGPNIGRPALAQILTFLMGTILLIVYGAKMLRHRSLTVRQTTANQDDASD